MVECNRDQTVGVKIEDCPVCEHTGREEIPWSELFTLGREYRG